MTRIWQLMTPMVVHKKGANQSSAEDCLSFSSTPLSILFPAYNSLRFFHDTDLEIFFHYGRGQVNQI